MVRPRLLLVVAWACLVVPSLATAQAPPDPQDIVINEIQYAPDAGSEYIELYNRSIGTVDLSDLAYADENRDFAPVATTETPLSPGDYVVLVRDTAAFRSVFPGVEYRAPDGWRALNNGGDTVYLRRRGTSTTIDSVPYAPSWGGNDGRSLERIDPDGASTRPSNFGTSTAAAGGTPAAENSIFNPDETAPRLTRVTPTSGGDSLRVLLSEPPAPTTVSADAFRLADPGAPAITSAFVSSEAPRRVRCTFSAPLPPGAYTLVATDIADRSGNTRSQARASFRYVETRPPDSGDVVVTELLYAPSPASNEFIELYNRAEHAVDLSRLAYADADRNFDPVALRRTVLRPDSHAVIVRDSVAFTAAFPGVAFGVPPGWDALNNGGDTVYLRDAPSGTTLDAVPYDPSWGGAGGRSLERVDPAGPSDVASNFASSTAPAGATPGTRNSQYDPDRTPPRPIFAGQTGRRSAAVHFSEPVQDSTVTADAFGLTDVTVETAEVRADSVAALTLSGPPTDPRVTAQGIADRTGNVLDATRRPLALRPDSGAAVINEVMYDPRTDDFDDRPNQVEYLELFNQTDEPLTLQGLRLTDRPDERGVADTVRAGRLRVLPPGGFAVVAARPNATSLPDSRLARAFPDAPLASDSVAVLPVDAQRLGLGNDGGLVRVHRADGTVIARVRYRPDWHAEALEDPSGTALERISPKGRANAPDNWTSSVADAGGTPGQANSVTRSPTDGPPADTGLRITPSPFSVERDGATRIRYRLSEVPNLVRVRIYDARGRRVRTLEDARLAGRRGTLVWNGRDDTGNRVRVGIYVVLFEAVRAGDGTVARFKETVVVARPLN